jgi:anaerobic selenocysteine-containing dehydrogenase
VFEHTDLHKSYGHYLLQYSEPVIAPVGESLSNPALFARLARAMGFDEPALVAEEAELLADAIEPALLAAVRRDRAVPLSFAGASAPVQFGSASPTTASGKVELCPPELGAVGYRPAPAGPPLTLLSPASDRTINSILGEFNLPQPRLTMHPDDAAARGLRDGDPVRVFNALGEVHVPLRVSRAVRAGVLSLPKGLWRHSTLNGATATALVSDDYTDIGDGACFNDARVEVARL